MEALGVLAGVKVLPAADGEADAPDAKLDVHMGVDAKTAPIKRVV